MGFLLKIQPVAHIFEKRGLEPGPKFKKFAYSEKSLMEFFSFV